MENLSFDAVENLRKVMGTLPSERPVKSTNIKNFESECIVTLEDSSENPYKAMFVTSTSTWGTNEFVRKWPITSVEGKLEVVKAVLTHNTLPQAKEMVQFVFRVKGVPRWFFDHHTQAVKFIAFMSIGCRDNNKIDSDVIKAKADGDEELFSHLKDLYELALTDNQGSWQTARAFLPQSYSHAYHFGQNLLSIVGTKGFHASKKFNLDDTHDYHLAILYSKVQKAVAEKFPLLGLYLDVLFSSNNERVFDKIRDLKVEDLHESDYKLFLKD